MAKVKIRLRAEIVKEKGRVRLVFKNPAYYHQQVSQFKFDKHVLVTIENERSQRTPNQNRYWHGVCYPILSDLTGYTLKEVKKVTKFLCFPEKIIEKEIFGRATVIEPESSKFSKGEGVVYTRFLREKAEELNGYIPFVCEAGYWCNPDLCENPDCPNKS